jgi:hypothetical protein
MQHRPTSLLLSVLLSLLPLAGCTTRAWYEGAKASAESECRKQPPGGYEDYEKERTRK